MKNKADDHFSLIASDLGHAAFQQLLADPRVKTLMEQMPYGAELGEGVVAAAFLRASEPAQLQDTLDKSFSADILSVDEKVVQDAKTAIREYAAMVGAQAHRPQ